MQDLYVAARGGNGSSVVRGPSLLFNVTMKGAGRGGDVACEHLDRGGFGPLAYGGMLE